MIALKRNRALDECRCYRRVALFSGDQRIRLIEGILMAKRFCCRFMHSDAEAFSMKDKCYTHRGCRTGKQTG